MRIIEKKSRKISFTNKLKIAIILSSVLGVSAYVGVGLYIYNDIGDFSRDLERYYWPDSEDYAYTGDKEFKDFYSTEANWILLRKRANVYESWTDEYCIARDEWDCSTTHISINFKHGMTSPFTNYMSYENELNDFLTNRLLNTFPASST